MFTYILLRRIYIMSRSLLLSSKGTQIQIPHLDSTIA